MFNTKYQSPEIKKKEEWSNLMAVKAFHDRFRALRADYDASQQFISEKLDVTRQTVAKYEAKDSNSLPNIEQLNKICELFKVSPNYLLGYSNITCDHKKNYGLSDTTINLLNLNPHIHQFLDYFVEQLVENNLEESISQLGIINNVEKAWEQVFPKKLMIAIDKSYTAMIKRAAFSACINSTEMEKELRLHFLKPKNFITFFNKELSQDGKNFILQETPDFKSLSEQEQYDCFIKTISSWFVEIKSIQYVYRAEHKKISQQILEIINNYVELITIKENKK